MVKRSKRSEGTIKYHLFIHFIQASISSSRSLLAVSLTESVLERHHGIMASWQGISGEMNGLSLNTILGLQLHCGIFRVLHQVRMLTIMTYITLHDTK